MFESAACRRVKVLKPKESKMGHKCNCACDRNEIGELTGLCGLHQGFLYEELNKSKKKVRAETIENVIRTYEEALEAIGGLNPMRRRMIKLYVEDQIDDA